MGIVSGLLIGQGSLFLVQSWLIADGKFSAVASLGFAIAVLSLVQWISDWSGINILARDAIFHRGPEPIRVANRARLLISVPVVCVHAAFVYFGCRTDEFESGILYGGLLVGPIWSLNIIGFLDGSGKSARSGPLTGIPWFAASLASYTLLRAGPASSSAGFWVGAAYSAGCAGSVLLQHLTIRSLLRSSKKVISRRELLAYLSQGLFFSLGDAPGQVYARVVILIVDSVLGSQMAGVYIYIRQLISAAAQFVGAIKRVELPGLGGLVSLRRLTVSSVFQAQRVSFAVALLAAGGCVAAWAGSSMLPARFRIAAAYLPLFGITVPLWAVANTTGQLVMLVSMRRAYSITMAATTFAAGLLTVATTSSVGLGGVALADVAMLCVQTAIFAHVVQRRFQS